MKVILESDDVDQWSKICLCTGNGNVGNGCGAKLLVEQDDLYSILRYGNWEQTSIAFVCPICSIQTNVLHVPDLVKHFAKRYHLDEQGNRRRR